MSPVMDANQTAFPGSQTPPPGAVDRLRLARQSGDPGKLSEALADHAAKLVQEGKFGFARGEIDEAIAINQRLGNKADEARLTQFSATLFRLEGNLSQARERALRAANLAGDGSPVAVAAATELGEICMAEGNNSAAAFAYGEALEHGRRAGLIEPLQASLLRKKAAALARAGKPAEAATELEIACQILERNQDLANALHARVEQATALQQGGDWSAAEAVSNAVRPAAEAAGDHAVLADLDILTATDALSHHNSQAALQAAQSARRHALAGRAPLQYISAASAISQLFEKNGDRVNAYGALATGWATLGDLLGPQVARQTFEPLLQQMRERWGAAAFWEVKAGYEAVRRAAIEKEKAALISSSDHSKEE